MAYWSQSIHTPEFDELTGLFSRIRYSATEAECLGMHNAIMHWAPYLQNGLPFDVVVDHQALIYLVNGQGNLTNRRLLTMILNLQGFRFNVLYRQDGKHIVADAVSRLLQYDDRGTYYQLDLGTSSAPVPPDLDITLMRKIMLDHEFIRPGNAHTHRSI